jgi:hypothetical protein
MEKLLITRRAASLGVLLSIVAVSYGKSSLDTDSSAIPTNFDDLAFRWGSDGTRELLSNDLERFFDNETGEYLASGDNVAFRKDEMPRRHSNGEYFLADQIRLPLRGVASHRTALANEQILYHSFIHGNPYVRAFIKTANNKITAVALGDLMDIVEGGQAVGVVPRITLFYRDQLLPIDLQNEAVKAMTTYYSQFAPDTSMFGYDIRLFGVQLPSKS